MVSAELKSKILKYLEQVNIATRNEIMRAVGKSGKSLTVALEELIREGVIELVSEKPLAYRFVGSNIVEIDLSEIKSYYDLKLKFFKTLRDFGWRLSTHEIAAVALMYARFTKFRVLVFGSQAVGKTSIISAVFGNIDEPLVLQDLHLRNLYDVIRSVKTNTKVIEQQYRHNWGKELLGKYDKCEVIPISKIAPSELVFRFIPLRITLPRVRTYGMFKPVKFEFLNVPRIVNDLSEEVLWELEVKLSKLKYFTIDLERLIQAVDSLKADEMVNYTDDVSAEFYRINARFDSIKSNDVKLANWKYLREFENLHEFLVNDLQIWNNALEVLKFNYSWLKDEEKAVQQTVDFMRDVFETFTIVKEE
ncbi:winged helix-turn-helix domain-containing protein [Thermococcus sp. M39]|uniref:winged helix-turn-helix domain-containing protein n=1 Tax=Thermococcus sp. M39 TaxID=1638262 RepID=UPI00143B3255|nr:winged helix-turn-helix domain-containing protein [Thermococcus sp. M39]